MAQTFMLYIGIKVCAINYGSSGYMVKEVSYVILTILLYNLLLSYALC